MNRFLRHPAILGWAFAAIFHCAPAIAQDSPVPSLIFASSTEETGPVKVSSSGAWAPFAIAAENLGYPISIAAQNDRKQSGLIFSVVNNLTNPGMWVTFCQTDPKTGDCVLGFTSGSVYLDSMPTGQPYTFSVWVAEGYPHAIQPPGVKGDVVILVYDLEFNIYGMFSVPVVTE